MEQIENKQEKMRQYLLGVLSGQEQAALEDEYLNSDESFEQMVAAENELVDRYVRSRLIARERQQFEHHYLAHPDRRERVDFARALHSRLDQHAASLVAEAGEKATWWQRVQDFFQVGNLQLATASAMALVMLALGIVSFYLLKRADSGSQQIALTVTPTIQPTPSVTAPPPPHLNQGPPSPALPSPTAYDKPAPVFASLVFVAGGLRGDDNVTTPHLSLSSKVDYARLQVKIRRQDYPTYQASLRSASGADVWSQQGLKSKINGDEETITITIPANKLAAGDYVLTLRGVTAKNEVDEVSKSPFRVERK